MTGRETSLQALLERLQVVEERLEGTAFLQEVRLDYLSDARQAIDHLGPWAGRVLVTCRPPRQGGAYEGSESDRLRVLERVSGAGPRWIDIEADVPPATGEALRRAGAGGIVASWHLWSEAGAIPPARLSAAVDRLRDWGADAGKLAVSVSDAAELAGLRALSSTHDGLFTIGMGFAGALSRCRYPDFGAPWTYVSSATDSVTAPGQMSLDEALAWGLPEAAAHPFLALLGGPQIADSPGPGCYNRLFRRRGKPWSYVPVVTTSGEDALALVRDLGALGAAVTMPNKDAARRFARPDAVVEEVGAANTVRFDTPPRSTNTDVAGVRGPLRRTLACLDRTVDSALVVGAGGAAQAAIQACRDLGLSVSVTARRSAAAEALVGEDAAVPWANRASFRSAVLINATPLGGTDSPWPAGAALDKTVVFDLTLDPAPSALLEQAREEGAVTLDGLEMWLEQGAAQTRFLTDLAVSVEDLREALS